MLRLIDAKDAAELLNVPPRWLLAQARRNAVPHHRLGRYVRFTEDELEGWLSGDTRGPGGRRKRRPPDSDAP